MSQGSSSSSSRVVQSRRFQCLFDSVGNIVAAFRLLQGIPAVTYIVRSDSTIYLETDKKKALSFVSRLSYLLINVQSCSSCTMLDSSIVERHGVPMRVVNLSGPKKTQVEELQVAYSKVRSDNAPPDFTGDISYMVNRDKYDAVMAQALFDNAREHFELALRPWQRQVINLLHEQNSRHILWVFDYDGNTGKTQLGKYLMFKMNYQVLACGRSHDLAGILNPFANGYVFDCPRNAFTSSEIRHTNEMFGVIEDIKDRYLVSGKYKGVAKITASHKVVVFANQIPSLEKVSLDRWSFFHTKLGSVGIHCAGFKDELYSCTIERENKVSDIQSCHKLPESKTDKDAIKEYMGNFNVPGNLRLIASNSLAFPNAKPHAATIYRLWRNHRQSDLLEYLELNDCMKDSISTIEVLRQHLEG